MIYKNFLKYLYFLLLFLILIPSINAQNSITDMLSDFLGIPVDTSFLILLVSLFFILYFILQKGTQKIFGNTTIANVISFLITLIAIIFMPPELFSFLAKYTVLIVALAFIIFPLILINMIGIKGKKVKHFILILIYIGAIWAISKLSSIDEFRSFFELELPFIFGDITIKILAYIALGIAVLISLIIIIKESRVITQESNLKRAQELAIKAETAKHLAERKKLDWDRKKEEKKLKKIGARRAVFKIARLLLRKKK